jgi:hypothetical protein
MFDNATAACNVANAPTDARHYLLNSAGQEYYAGSWIAECYPGLRTSGASAMSKPRDSNREGKKKPTMTMKEKRASRKGKKETKGLLGSANGRPDQRPASGSRVPQARLDTVNNGDRHRSR